VPPEQYLWYIRSPILGIQGAWRSENWLSELDKEFCRKDFINLKFAFECEKNQKRYTMTN